VRVGGTPLPTDPLRPVRRPGLPWWWVAVAILVLAAVFLVGFYVGQEDEPTRGSRNRGAAQDQGDGGGQGNRQARRERRMACRTALDLSLQMNELQQGALVQQAELAAAVAAEDVGRIDELRESLEAVTAETSQIESQLEQALSTCRP
jgi:hypothetical protein